MTDRLFAMVSASEKLLSIRYTTKTATSLMEVLGGDEDIGP